MVVKIIDRITLPRYSDGCDWGAPRILLARRGRRELWWQMSSRVWAGLLDSYQHEPGSLCLVAPGGGFGVQTTELHRGGRLSRALLLQHRDRIEEFLGCPGLADSLSTRQTVIIEEEP